MRVGDLVEDKNDAVLRNFCQRRRGEGVCFRQQALVHGVRTELCIDNVGPHQFRLKRQGNAVVGEAAQRVLGREQAAEAARRVFERGLDRVPTIEDGEPGCVAGARACRRPLATVPLHTNPRLPGSAGHVALFPCVPRLCKPRVPPDLRMFTARWWGRQDSNLRRHSQRIYSPPPLPLGTLPQSRRTVLISKDKSGSPAGRVVSVLCGSYPRQVNGWWRWMASKERPRGKRKTKK